MKKIGTHDGVFHADDAFGVGALLLLPEFADAKMVRSRNPAVLAECDARVDIGGLSNWETDDFDHHQRGGAGCRENMLLFAAFGLVWDKYGPEISGSKEVALLVDELLVQVVDAQDNGVELYRLTHTTRPMTVSNVLSVFNPTWQEPSNFDEAFKTAVEMAKMILLRVIAKAKALITARDIVRKALLQMVDPKLLILDQYCPWQSTVMSEASDVLYVVFPDNTNGTWRVQAVAQEEGSFATRRPLPEAWAGLKDDAFATLTGVPDAMFCHQKRFIAGAKSRGGALALAKIALEHPVSF
jgi:uncharacterized UPF0160 family protein